VANIEEARQAKAPARASAPPRKPKPPAAISDDVESHLPAFLLRPVRLKA
jgi:hypothetical protein